MTLKMDYWDEIRTAAAVAREGTISDAAKTLGVHRATVNRHIDILESELGAKLFLRHAKGFTPTELGADLLRVADATDEQFNQLQRRAKKQIGELSGEIVVTVVNVLAKHAMPAFALFQAENPNVKLKIISTDNILKLEYGEAHIALRAGKKPQAPDNVVIPFVTLPMALYATKDYVQAYGKPETSEDLKHHNFVGPSSTAPKTPFLVWMTKHVPPSSIRTRSNNPQVIDDAIMAGLGIGFLPQHLAQSRGNLIEIEKPRPRWEVRSWVVTHMDLHRTAKVQEMLKSLKRWS